MTGLAPQINRMTLLNKKVPNFLKIFIESLRQINACVK